jgi:osmoprotectant transport system permease protein
MAQTVTETGAVGTEKVPVLQPAGTNRDLRDQFGPPALAVLVTLVAAALIYHVSDLSWYSSHQDETWTAFWQHVRLTAVTLGIACAIALPLGTLIARVALLYTPIIGLLGAIYTIPSLALLAFLVAYVDIGFTNAVIALVAYAQFILVRNVVVGLRQVDRGVLDAARGMGMSSAQILFKIEYPLALPVMLGGLRIAAVATIAIATIAFLIDAGGLGKLLFDGINNSFISTSEIQVGALAVSALALVADLLLRIVERLLPASRARASTRR